MFVYILTNMTQKAINETSLTLELLLSILAIVISIGSVVFEYFWNKKINKTNLEADFFKDIYRDYLMNKLPNARNVILYNNRIISATDDLINVLNDIRRSSLFYKYKDKKFYDKLCKQLQDLEDELVNKTDETIDYDDFTKFVNKINLDIENIYNTIMDKYIGKK